jgi:hypothetical protein
MDIDKEIIQNTKCKKQFACLNIKDHMCCKVDRCINNQFCLVEDKVISHCNHRASFGYSGICHCLVRMEIYNKHNR